ncbi:leucine-rich repeat-containing protein 4-like [Branchiostoma floridae]|uniref:Leucine-rich repeat-containing protein 4-like n=1 Tax=Branchiostoma floridae TaxID=7739 RepID=A0A9J7MQA8_BRAFL|nr:leucine-rich repeat-containing protein 4-like [Branchiostoma floridae]
MFTGLGNLETLSLYINEMSEIQADSFNFTPQLIGLSLSRNKLTNLRSDMFTGLGNLEELWLHTNEINDIQAGTFSLTPQLTKLYLHKNKLISLSAGMFTGLPSLSELQLQDNQMVTLPSEAYNKLLSIRSININNNPWQCDCRMLPFRQKMTGYRSFEYQITCEGPSNFHGQKLKDISPEDLMSDCEEPTILKFERVHNNTAVEGETLHLVCEASGIPTPDITVTLPSGLNVTVESLTGRRVTVEVNGTIPITKLNVTAAADDGLYVCAATSPVGSTFATLLVDVQMNVATTGTVTTADTTGTVTTADTTGTVTSEATTGTVTTVDTTGTVTTADTTGTVTSEATTGTVTTVDTTGTVTTADTTGTVTSEATTGTMSPVSSPLAVTNTSLNKPDSSTSFSLPVLIGCVCGSVAGTVLLGAIIFTVWYKRKTQNPPSDPTPPVVFSNASASVTISGQGQTGQGGAQQPTGESLNARHSSDHAPGRPTSLEYEDVSLPKRNMMPNGAGPRQPPSKYQSLGPRQQPAEYQSLEPMKQSSEYQSLGPNKNRVPSDDLPPLPLPTGANNTQHYYQSLKRHI